jgi:alpha-mannosidase
MPEQLHIILVPHTHWDREWYQTFQQFRVRLVKTIDTLLNILDHDERFRYFMLDGQTIVLDDYLEVRPEQEERLARYIRSGRILTGPWYVQPDEFLVSGEALIRNLQVGLRRAAQFGPPMRVGYVPDCFGHIAQLPQILRGVGIDNAVFWRGVGAEAQKSEFYWAAPDGTTVLVLHLADPLGYSNARQMPLNPDDFAMRVELLVANLLPKATTNMLLFMNGSDHLEPQAGLPAVIEAANQRLAQLDPQRQHLLTSLEAGDSDASVEYDAIDVQIGTLPQYIQRVREVHTIMESVGRAQPWQTLSGEMRSSQFAHLLPSVLSSRMWIKQQNNTTEHLLERWVEPLTAWASRLNDGYEYPAGLIALAWRYLLQNHPHDSICGCSIDQVHRENAVRFAQSQQIGESVLQQAMQAIAAQVDTRVPFAVPHPSHQPVPILVFNPAGARNERVQFEVQLPGSLHNAAIVDAQGRRMPYHVVQRWRQEMGSLPVAREMLATAAKLAGVTTPGELIQMARTMMAAATGQSEEDYDLTRVYIEHYTESPIHHEPHAPQPGVVYVEVMVAPRGRVYVNEQEILAAGQQLLDLLEREDIHTLEVSLVDQARETIEMLAYDLPAYGYKTFWLYPRGLSEQIRGLDTIDTHLTAGESSIENEFYRVTADPRDGTLTVLDKMSETTFSGLNRFIDGGDVGDLYNYCPPENDLLVSEPAETPRIEVVNHAPLALTLRVSSRWSLPGACTANRKERSVRLTSCPIVSEITLTAGVQRVDIHTSVENKVRDHRLRVLFPVPYLVEQVAVDGTFEVRMRPARHPEPEDKEEWIETPVSTFPQKRFVDVGNEESGLSVLNRGLPEYEVVLEGPGIRSGQEAGVAITLLRCVEWLSRGDLQTRRGHAGPMEHTPEAQCLGRHEFDYALVPHTGDWQAQNGLVLREALAFNTPLTTRTMTDILHEGRLAAQATLLSAEPCTIVISAIKRQQDGEGIVVRVYNPQARSVQAQIHPHFAYTQVFLTDLLEETREPLTSEQGGVAIAIRGGGIITLIFV